MLWAEASGEDGGAEGDFALQAPSLVEEALPSRALLCAPLLTVLPVQSLAGPSRWSRFP